MHSGFLGARGGPGDADVERDLVLLVVRADAAVLGDQPAGAGVGLIKGLSGAGLLLEDVGLLLGQQLVEGLALALLERRGAVPGVVWLAVRRRVAGVGQTPAA